MRGWTKRRRDVVSGTTFNYGGKGEDKMIYGSESFQVVPARPYDKGKLEVS
jgi:hypothetical protein